MAGGARGGRRGDAGGATQSWALILNSLAAFQERDLEIVILATKHLVCFIFPTMLCGLL